MDQPGKPIVPEELQVKPPRGEPSCELLPITSIRRDGRTQTRLKLNQEAVGSYAELMKGIGPSALPPVIVFRDEEGQVWLADGFHRVQAAERNKCAEISARVHLGTRLDALKHSFQANQTHGVRRTNADKRYSVELALGEESLRGLSDRAIAELCGVGNQLVGTVRQKWELSMLDVQVCGSHTSSTPTKRTGSDGKRYPSRTSKRKAAAQKTHVQAGQSTKTFTVERDRVDDPTNAIDREAGVQTDEEILTTPAEPAQGQIAPDIPVEKSDQTSALSRDPRMAENSGLIKPAGGSADQRLSPMHEGFVLLDGSRLPPDTWDEGPIEQKWLQEWLNSLLDNNRRLPDERRRNPDAMRAEQVCLIELVRSANRLLQTMSSPGERPITILNSAVCQLRNYTAPRSVSS